MDRRLPQDRIGLGVGLDLPWGDALVRDPGGDHVSDRVAAFLDGTRGRFRVAFGSWQPRSRGRFRAEHAFAALDDWWARVGPVEARSLHHTALNLATPERPDRGPLLAMTERIVERYGIRWINEDLGLWSIRGHTLPYPLPPLLTAESLRDCVRNVREVAAALPVPLLVEFPGFGEGFCPIVGDLDAYDFFRRTIEEAEVPCTLDTGHLLSWRWRCGHRGEALFDGLERLPLAACFEIHLSGCSIVDGRLYDAHHGVLLPEQLLLLDRLLERCPGVKVVTFEDPRFDADGRLPPRVEASLRAVEDRVAAWLREDPPTPPVEAHSPPLETGVLPSGTSAPTLDSLWQALRTSGPGETETARAAAALRRHVARRRSAGIGTLRDAFPSVFAEPGGHTVVDAFVASPEYDAAREVEGYGAGPCLEEAFAAFCARRGVRDPRALADAYLRAAAVALAVDPDPLFRVPAGFEAVEGGYCSVRGGSGTRVWRTRGNQLLTGLVGPPG